MIRYSLICDREHEFDGWFASSDGFDAQLAAGEVLCPHCGSPNVSKALMAPNIARGKALSADTSPQAVFAEKLGMMMLALKKHVEENCDYVGDAFAEEARRIHYGEVDPRNIYGQTTPDEAEELRDEGIAFAAIPWVPVDDH